VLKLVCPTVDEATAISAFPGELGSGLSNLDLETMPNFVFDDDSWIIFY